MDLEICFYGAPALTKEDPKPVKREPGSAGSSLGFALSKFYRALDGS